MTCKSSPTGRWPGKPSQNGRRIGTLGLFNHQPPSLHLRDRQGWFRGFDAGGMFFIGGFRYFQWPTRMLRSSSVSRFLCRCLASRTQSTRSRLRTDSYPTSRKARAGFSRLSDGQALHNLQADLVKTDFFSAGPTLVGSWANDQGVEVGKELTSSKGAGFWIVIEGLSKGTHTLEFGGHSASTNTTINTHDVLHIV